MFMFINLYKKNIVSILHCHLFKTFYLCEFYLFIFYFDANTRSGLEPLNGASHVLQVWIVVPQCYIIKFYMVSAFA